MIDDSKLAYLTKWADKNNCVLQTKGEVGFGRTCVGIVYQQCYVDYDPYVDHGDITAGMFWTPENSYHKHNCLAVLVRPKIEGELEDDDTIYDYDAGLEELYEWVKWLDEHNFVVEVRSRETYNKDAFGRSLELMLHGPEQAILVRKSA